MPASPQGCGALLKCCGPAEARCSDHTTIEDSETDEGTRTEPNPVNRRGIKRGRGAKKHRVMTPTVRQLFLVCLFWFLGPWSTTDASPFDQWEDGIELRKVRGIQSEDLSDVLWRDQNEDQVQNVFKRFLFHYSKARNSVGAVQHESHSVHPLMRLSPKLSQMRNKKVVLLKIRGLPEGML
ncbi:neuromedin-S [Dicentrarchus labrax]|uniref:Neuromedin-S n=2 Tax=Moronidae TaxID=42148 RepID=A0A8P4JZB8_DICLA|nr:neuromedin-S [Dicentrarchus labrax]